MRPGAVSLMQIVDASYSPHFDADMVFTVTISEMRDLVYELRYAQSEAESAALALAEREAGEDMDGNLLSSVEDFATIRGHEFVHVAACPCPQMTERWAHLRRGIRLADDE